MSVISSIPNSPVMAVTPARANAQVESSTVGSQREPLVKAPLSQAVADKPVLEADVKKAVDGANRALVMQGSNETISFTYEEKLNQLYVQIRDQNTGEVVREIPSKDFIRNQVAMREMIGLILDKLG